MVITKVDITMTHDIVDTKENESDTKFSKRE